MDRLWGVDLPYPEKIPLKEKIKFAAEHYAGLATRKLGQIQRHLKSIPPADSLDREEGITAIMPVRNEEFIEPSLLSIKDFADEFVILDSSTDDTPEKIQRIKEEHDLNMTHIQKETDILTALQMGLEESSCRWILKWEGDAVAYERIHKIKDIIDSLDDKKYYVMYPPLLQMSDFFHVNKHPASPFNIEQRFFKYSPWAKYELDSEGIADTLKVPMFYEKIPIKFVCVMHLIHAKTPSRKLFKKYRNAWVTTDQSEYDSYEEFVDIQLKKEYGTTDRDKILENLKEEDQERMSKNKVTYEKNAFGDYPEPLKEYLYDEYGIDIDEGKISEIKEKHKILR